MNQPGHVTGLRLGGWDEIAGRTIGNGLVGTIPPELGDLAHLRVLLLAGNELTGPIPAELGRLTHLLDLNLGGNALTGTIPPTLANLTSLEWLSLWGNSWTSEPAPAWLGELTGLEGLDLGGHQLTGPIPSTWRNLRDLENLYLWGNRLTGPIPAWFGSLANLHILNVNGNELTGPLPGSLTHLSNLVELDISGTGVCVPDDPAIHAWLARIPRFISSGLTCAGSPPAVAATLPNRTLAQGGTLDVDLSQAFVDPDGDALIYTVSSSAPHLVAALVTGARLRLTALDVGTATILVDGGRPRRSERHAGIHGDGHASGDRVVVHGPSDRGRRDTAQGGPLRGVAVTDRRCARGGRVAPIRLDGSGPSVGSDSGPVWCICWSCAPQCRRRTQRSGGRCRPGRTHHRRRARLRSGRRT